MLSADSHPQRTAIFGLNPYVRKDRAEALIELIAQESLRRGQFTLASVENKLPITSTVEK